MDIVRRKLRLVTTRTQRVKHLELQIRRTICKFILSCLTFKRLISLGLEKVSLWSVRSPGQRD